MLHSILNIELRDVNSVTNDTLVIITARAKGALAKPVKYSVFVDEDTLEEVDVDAKTIFGESTIDLVRVTREVSPYQHVDEATGAIHPTVCTTLSVIIQPNADDPDEAVRNLFSRLVNKGQIAVVAAV